MKFHFGHGITIAMILFMIYILGFVFTAFQKDVDLVAENYYEKEIQFQDHIDKMENEVKLEDKVHFKQSLNAIELFFPYDSKTIEGEIRLYHVSVPDKDKVYHINLNDEGIQYIPTKDLKGRYKLKIEWKMEGKDYFKELQVNI